MDAVEINSVVDDARRYVAALQGAEGLTSLALRAMRFAKALVTLATPPNNVIVGSLFSYRGARYYLTPQQRRLIQALLNANGKALSYAELHQVAYERVVTYANHNANIRSQMKRLRMKLGSDCPINNHSGVGYSWSTNA